MLESASFWAGLGFVIFVVATFVPISRKIGGSLDARAAEIEAKLNEAQKLREDAQAALAEYQRKQRDAIKEADEIISHAKAEAERLAAEAEVRVAETIKRREAAAVEKIQNAEAKALQEVRDEAVDIALAATEKLIVDGMSDEVRGRMTKDAINDISKSLQ